MLRKILEWIRSFRREETTNESDLQREVSEIRELLRDMRASNNAMKEVVAGIREDLQKQDEKSKQEGNE